MNRGVYLALEGVEGSGKSTVSRIIRDRLAEKGIRSQIVREPGGTALGEELRRLLLHSGDVAPWAEAALFAASRAQLTTEVVGPALDSGEWVISDRTYYSSLAYQGGGRGLGIETVRSLNETVLAGVTPDVVFVLDIDPEVGFARELHRDRMGDEGVSFQHQVATAYRQLAERDHKVVLIDATSSSESVADEILGQLEAVRRAV